MFHALSPIGRRFGSDLALFPLEELNRAFVLLRQIASGEGAEVPSLAGLRIFLSRI